MTPQLIPVCETYEALVAGARKTAAMRACTVFKTSSTFENFPAVTAYVLGLYHAQGFFCANNLLHVSHLKGFIFRWTLFVSECRSSDMVNFSSHCEQGKRGPSSSSWCCILWWTRFLFCTYDFPHSGQRCRPRGTYFCRVEVINGWTVVSTSTSAETPIAGPSVTADISICNMESSNLVSNLDGMI